MNGEINETANLNMEREYFNDLYDIYIYIYMEREREREYNQPKATHNQYFPKFASLPTWLCAKTRKSPPTNSSCYMKEKYGLLGF